MPTERGARPAATGVRPSLGVPADAALIAVLFLAALALRPQLVGVAPVVPDIQAELGVSHAVAGLLGTIPVLCMGLFAPIAPLVAGRTGTAVAVGLGVALIGFFGLVRAFTGGIAELVVLTFGVGIGMGIAGALMPVVVKERMAARPVAGTVAYSSGLQLGSAASAALAVPIAFAFGGWRAALVVFSVATLVVLVPWLLVAARGQRSAPRIAISWADFADRRGWILAAVFALYGIAYYGWIAWLPDTYAELGWSAAAAGGVVGVLNVGSLFGALTVGSIAGRVLPYGTSLAFFGGLFAIAAAGFVVVPGGALAWALVAGYANGALFPLLLALPLRLAGSADRVAGLSSVMLGIGYTVAAISPVALGAVRDATGSFRLSLGFVAAIAVMFAFGLALVGRWRESPGQSPPRPR
ncbi:MAG TPA: MFS transporter [Candidatus Limnocylindrales bacterium]|nr:MFS transporter [Candidatus Limnocylindrales bacterium]